MSFTNKMLHIFHPVLASLPPGWLCNATRGHWGTRERGLGYFWGEGERGGEKYFCHFLRRRPGGSQANFWSLRQVSPVLPGGSYVFPQICVHVSIVLLGCVYVSEHAWASMFICMYMYGVHMHSSMYQKVCICMYVICLYVYIHKCMYMCVCECAHVSAYAWVCIVQVYGYMCIFL